MRFLHISDCHLGGWKNEKLEDLNFKAFSQIIDEGIKNNIEAIIIAGDFFDIPIPSPKIFVKVVKKLKEVANKGIKIYAIEGSHDTANDVGIINFLEAAEIIKNVDFKKNNSIDYFIDNDVFIIGLSGKKRGKEVYEIKELKEFLERNKERFIDKKKILVVHSNIQELSEIPGESLSIKDLPNYFDYYALGHIHDKKILKKSNKIYLYPGPIFPTNFEEFERLKGSGFVVDLEKNELKEIQSNVCDVLNLKINANKKNPFSLTEEIIEELKKNEIKNKVITLRIEGTMEKGTLGQIDFARINEIVEKNNSILLRNTSKLNSKEFEVKEFEEALNYDLNAIEKEFVKKFENSDIIFDLIDLLSVEKLEGETNIKFEERLLREIKKKEDSILEKLKC